MSQKRSLLISAITLLSYGCDYSNNSTTDSTIKKHVEFDYTNGLSASSCRVHKVAMTKKSVDVFFGMPGKEWSRFQMANPNSDQIPGGCILPRAESWSAIGWVCPGCVKGSRATHDKKAGTQPN